jgi:hypothetical protein
LSIMVAGDWGEMAMVAALTGDKRGMLGGLAASTFSLRNPRGRLGGQRAMPRLAAPEPRAYEV